MAGFRLSAAASLAVLWAAGAPALEMPPGAILAAGEAQPLGSYPLPLGPWTPAGGLPVHSAEGRVDRQAWHLDTPAGTLAVLRDLREQARAEGYEVLFECDAATCGGFDFRYATPVLPEPEMHVDLSDWRFLSARRTNPDGDSVLSLLVSRSGGTVFVQVTRVGPPDAADPAALPVETLATKSPDTDTALDATAAPAAGAGADPAPLVTGDLAAALVDKGRVVLDGLSFDTGSARLAEGPFPALEALAQFLNGNPEARVTLVGHTDAEGALDANIALSRARARAVVDELVADYGVPRAQVAAEGVGYLMPLAPNTTEAGRNANRRVEAVLASTR